MSSTPLPVIQAAFIVPRSSAMPFYSQHFESSGAWHPTLQERKIFSSSHVPAHLRAWLYVAPTSLQGRQ